MTVPADAPDTITELSDILAGTAAWAAIETASDIYWPAESAIPGGTWAILEEGSDTHKIGILSDTLTPGTLMQLAHDLKYQLPSRYRSDITKLYIGLEITYEYYNEPSDAQAAGDGAITRAVILTLPIGLTGE